MHNVAGVLEHCKQSLGFPWVSPPPALESLQVAAARLGLFVLRPVLLPSGDGPSGNLELSGYVATSTIVQFPVGKTKRIYANMGIKLTVHNATLTGNPKISSL